MQYQEDTRTQEEKDRELKEWVQAHRVDYRQKQAMDTMPPEGPGGSYGDADGGDDGHKKDKIPFWMVLVLAFLVGGLIAIIQRFI